MRAVIRRTEWRIALGGSTDEVLAERARGGDHDAFTTLVTRHERRMYGLALRMLRHPEDAADAAQEAFLHCYRALDTYNGSHTFGAWLYRIAYNHCLDVLRRRRNAPLVPVSAEQGERVMEVAADPGPSVEDLAAKDVSLERLREAFDNLPDQYRHVLVLRYTLDLPYRDMAHVLDISESAVTMRLHHARGALRTRMIELGEDERGAS